MSRFDWSFTENAEEPRVIVFSTLPDGEEQIQDEEICTCTGNHAQEWAERIVQALNRTE